MVQAAVNGQPRLQSCREPCVERAGEQQCELLAVSVSILKFQISNLRFAVAGVAANNPVIHTKQQQIRFQISNTDLKLFRLARLQL